MSDLLNFRKRATFCPKEDEQLFSPSVLVDRELCTLKSIASSLEQVMELPLSCDI